MKTIFLCLCVALVCAKKDAQFLYGTFPDDFEWGVSTSAYQIEGAWNLDGKGESIWDHMAHFDTGAIFNGDTGDVACDSYHLFETDVAMLKELGVNFYRFSLSWSRILPTGRNDVINQDGIDYYNSLIDNLLVNGIKPMVTLYHWDLPQALQDEFDGWISEDIVDVFGDYATVAFSYFGDRVKTWITLNEPWAQAEKGYGYGETAPGIQSGGIQDYIVGHNLLKAHARAWHIYNETFRADQQGEIGITLDCHWYEPYSEYSPTMEAAERAIQFHLGWFANPIFSVDGDYPLVMREYVDRHSREEHYPVSRLPVFTNSWVAYIKGTSDFFGLNHYTTQYVRHGENGPKPSWDHDQDLTKEYDPEWPSSAAEWLKAVPWGFRKLLIWIRGQYNNPRVIVTGNGYADFGRLDDQDRADYHTSYIDEMYKAMNIDKCNVSAYTAWSLMDNMEWNSGYSMKFGLYDVNFNDPSRPRTPKLSAEVYKKIIQDNGLLPEPKK